LNYGRRCKNDLDEFKKSVQVIIDVKPYDIRNDFKNIYFDEAAKLGFGEEYFKLFGLSSEQAKKQFSIY
jgi:hypothetical protein